VTIVCGTRPAENQPRFRLRLTKPLPSAAEMPTIVPLLHGSAVELEDGTVCHMKPGGTSLVFSNKRVNYWCGEWNPDGVNTGILGELQDGTVWMAERVVFECGDEGWESDIDMVPIRVVWQ
jgi:hypothetical protein